MSEASIAEICQQELFADKRLVAPSLRVGHQWTATLLRTRHSWLNLRVTSLMGLALEAASARLAEQKKTLAPRSLGRLIVESVWDKVLTPSGYLGRLHRSPGLAATVAGSLKELRMCGFRQTAGRKLPTIKFEDRGKAKDLQKLLAAYEKELARWSFVDEADVFRLAIEELNRSPDFWSEGILLLLPEDLRLRGLQQDFLHAIPEPARRMVSSPEVEPPPQDRAALANLAVLPQHPPVGDARLHFYRAVGQCNEVREVLRRCLAASIPLDDVEILHTSTVTYVPLIYEVTQRLANADHPDGIPVTFAEGLSCILSRPGRALAAWLAWIDSDFAQTQLIRMLGDGLLQPHKDDVSFNKLVQLLRPLEIGLGRQHYLPRLKEQIDAQSQRLKELKQASDEETAAQRMQIERQRNGYRVLHKLIEQVLKASDMLTGGDPLAAAETFLNESARSVNALDKFAAESLLEQIREIRTWSQQLQVELNHTAWLKELPHQLRVRGMAPRPGHLHVAHVRQGGHSGRRHTFILGLDDRRFPGSALPDPILLNRERERLSPELKRSYQRLDESLEDFGHLLARLPGEVTCSWSAQALEDGREAFPSSALLSVLRVVTGNHTADLADLNQAAGPLVSFAPDTAEKALDESERWTWLLSQTETHGDRTDWINQRYADLAAGHQAMIERQRESFGEYDGHVPDAGRDLAPTQADAVALSASALELAGKCPLAFFFRNGLRLYRLDEREIELDRWLDAAEFGSLLHEVFRRFLEALAQQGLRPNFERDHVPLAEILKHEIDNYRQQVPPPNENAYRVQYWQLLEVVSTFLRAEEEHGQQHLPRFFEVSLGLESVGGGTPLDDAQPIQVQLPDGQAIKTKGRIDRIDEIDAGGFLLCDYKTGSAYGFAQNDPFRQGRRVQNVLYPEMVRAALAQQHPSQKIESFGYFFPGIKGAGLRLNWRMAELQPGLEILARMCRLIEQGAFAATDNADDCKYCDYQACCGNYQAAAARSKSLLDNVQIVELSELRGLRRGQ